MTKNVKTVLSVVSLIILAAIILVACSNNGSDKKDDTTAGAVTGQITVISREDGSGTRDAFTELMEVVDAEGNDATTQTAEITNSTSVMMSTVAGNERAIGYVSLGSLNDTVKAISVDGVSPSVDTVKDGSYKLQRPFNIAYIETAITDLDKDFISYIMSAEGQAIIENDGYISVGSAESYTNSGMSGTITISGSTSVAPVVNKLADAYKLINPDVKIEIQEPGSSAGIQSATEGVVEIAMSSRELKAEELEVLTSRTIALDGIAVIVNNGNSFDNITSEQIQSVFKGEVTKWEDIK